MALEVINCYTSRNLGINYMQFLKLNGNEPSKRTNRINSSKPFYLPL